MTLSHFLPVYITVVLYCLFSSSVSQGASVPNKYISIVSCQRKSCWEFRERDLVDWCGAVVCCVYTYTQSAASCTSFDWRQRTKSTSATRPARRCSPPTEVSPRWRHRWRHDVTRPEVDHRAVVGCVDRFVAEKLIKWNSFPGQWPALIWCFTLYEALCLPFDVVYFYLITGLFSYLVYFTLLLDDDDDDVAPQST